MSLTRDERYELQALIVEALTGTSQAHREAAGNRALRRLEELEVPRRRARSDAPSEGTYNASL